jgi:aspartate/methionine/tyrosine aminotransferase
MGWVRKGARNRDLVNLCQAVPSYPPAAEMQAEIARLAGDPATSLYTDIAGLPELRAALAEHMAADYGGGIAAQEVAIAAGCNQAFCAAIMAIAGRGDNVILPVPYYFNHQMWLAMLGIRRASFRRLPRTQPATHRGCRASDRCPHPGDCCARRTIGRLGLSGHTRRRLL